MIQNRREIDEDIYKERYHNIRQKLIVLYDKNFRKFKCQIICIVIMIPNQCYHRLKAPKKHLILQWP